MNREEMLELLSKLAEGIAKTFGKHCETLIQDLGHPDIPVLAIYNGHVSGREVGSTVDIFGNITKNFDHSLLQTNLINMMVERGSQKIKSTTMIVRGADYCFGFGINLDITLSSEYAGFLMEQCRIENYLDTAIASIKQGRLEKIFETCLEEIDIPLAEMKKDQRLALISLLQQRHAFDYQKAVPFVAAKLGVSRYTVYNYLKVVEQGGEPQK